jgi:hypothetical protein
MRKMTLLLRMLALVTFVTAISGTPSLSQPSMQAGMWKHIGPADVVMTEQNHVFCQGLAVDPRNPGTIYLCICAYDVSRGGLYKTTNYGTSWRKVGKLDEPIHIVIDPANSRHLYCVDGVRGDTQGFWTSEDAGETWVQPNGFLKAVDGFIGTRDLYSIATDPADFRHILVSFHSPWHGLENNCGVLESRDGGMNWVRHNPPAAAARGYGMAVFFLYDPESHQGSSTTWLLTTQSSGFFRTTDAGNTWSLAYDKQMTHGGCQIYRTRQGVLFAGGYQYPVRSEDNGASWKQVKQGLVYSWYIGICGDGDMLYTGSSNPGEPYFVSPERDGITWVPFSANGVTQKFSAVPFEMALDKKNHILYAASWHEGLLALKIK